MADDSREATPTLEGYYVLHDFWRVDWARWKTLPADARAAIAGQAAGELQRASAAGDGDSAAYAVIGQKADLLFLHYRDVVDALKHIEIGLRQLPLADVLVPAGSYLSMIEVSLGEAAAIAATRLGERGVKRGDARFDAAFAEEMEAQTRRLQGRLRPVLPPNRYLCFYPMSKRRGEQVNWYDLTADERRQLMRGHGRIGHKYHDRVTQVISGSIGLDDWEWGVDLHADDPLVFKKLITEMRFDPASSRYADFGEFRVGIRLQPAQLPDYLEGRLKPR